MEKTLEDAINAAECTAEERQALRETWTDGINGWGGLNDEDVATTENAKAATENQLKYLRTMRAEDAIGA